HRVIQRDQHHIEYIQPDGLTDHVHGLVRGNPDEACLALFFQRAQGFQWAFRTRVPHGIHRVVKQDIHVIHLQPLQAFLRVFDKARLAVRGVELAFMVPDSFLGGNRHLFADAHVLDDLADHFLIAPLLISGGGVKVAYAQFIGAAQESRDVRVHHPHADNRQRQARLAERTLQDRTGCGSYHRRIGKEQIRPPQDSRGARQSQRLDDELPAIPLVLVFHGWLLELSLSVLAAAIAGVGVRQENLIFGIARFAHAGDAHAALVADGAFGFADSATDAEIGIQARLLHRGVTPVRRHHLHFLEPNGFLGRGAVFFANNAGTRGSVGQAAVAIEERSPDAHLLFFLDGQLLNGVSRARLRTQCALVIAVTDPHFQHGSPQAGHPAFAHGRMNRVRRANFHALAAANALGQEFVFAHRTGRANQRRVEFAPFAHGAGVHQEHGPDARGSRNQKRSALQIQLHRARRPEEIPQPLEWRRESLRAGDVHAKRYGMERAGIVAIPAIETFRGFPSLSYVRIGPALTVGNAKAAFIADLVVALQPDDRILGRDAQQRAQGTDVAAPESRAIQVEQKDGEKDQRDEERPVEVRLRRSQHVPPQHFIDGFGHYREPGFAYARISLIDPREKRFDSIIRRGIEHDGGAPVKERKRIEP